MDEKRGAPSLGGDPHSLHPVLKRTFDIDIEHCPHCGGTLKIIAAIEHPTVIAKILAHLGLPTPDSIRFVSLSRQSPLPLSLETPNCLEIRPLGPMTGPKIPRSWTDGSRV